MTDRVVHARRSRAVRDVAPFAALPDRLFDELSLPLGSLAEAELTGRRAPVWLVPRSRVQEADVARDETAWFSRLAFRYLGVPIETETLELRLHFPAWVSYRVRPSVGGDLPTEATVDISKVAADTFRRGWLLAMHDEVAAPVRVRLKSEVPEGVVRMTLAFRVLLGMNASSESSVFLAELNTRAFKALDRLGATDSTRGRPRHVPLRALRLLAEAVFRRVLGAPGIPLRTLPSPVGDDTSRAVRLPPTVFPLLGIEPGDQVVLEWANRRGIAVALDANPQASEEESELVAKAGLTARHYAAATTEPVRHLAVRVPADLRAEMGVPRRTVVVVRRRTTRIAVKHLNRLALPIGGLVFGALAIPDFRWWIAVIAVALVVVLSFAPARHTRPPRRAL